MDLAFHRNLVVLVEGFPGTKCKQRDMMHHTPLCLPEIKQWLKNSGTK
jgi:hypothetical protein